MDIQSSQYYYYRYVFYYRARILLFSYYTSYHSHFFVLGINQHIYTIRSTYLKQFVLLLLLVCVILFSQSTIIFISYQLLYLTFYSTNYLVYSYYQEYISRVVSTIILIATYDAIQLEYYHSYTILIILPSLLQYQLTSTFILLEKYIQSSQYYYPYKSILCNIARVFYLLTIIAIIPKFMQTQ